MRSFKGWALHPILARVELFRRGKTGGSDPLRNAKFKCSNWSPSGKTNRAIAKSSG